MVPSKFDFAFEVLKTNVTYVLYAVMFRFITKNSRKQLGPQQYKYSKYI